MQIALGRVPNRPANPSGLWRRYLFHPTVAEAASTRRDQVSRSSEECAKATTLHEPGWVVNSGRPSAVACITIRSEGHFYDFHINQEHKFPLDDRDVCAVYSSMANACFMVRTKSDEASQSEEERLPFWRSIEKETSSPTEENKAMTSLSLEGSLEVRRNHAGARLAESLPFEKETCGRSRYEAEARARSSPRRRS